MTAFLPVPCEGRVVIVTGADGDLGASMAEGFHANGASVVLVDRVADPDAGPAWAAAGDPRVLRLAADLADPASAQAAARTALENFGRVDVLINNAAAQTARGTVDAVSIADWRLAIDVNLGGAFYMARAVVPAMRSAGRGVILNIVSQLGHVGIEGAAPYTASKGGLLNLTRTLALDHARDGIRVLSLSPGAVLTSRLTRLYGSPEAAEAALVPMHPIGRIGRCEDIANAALFLCSDYAGFVTGSDMLVDGGYTAR